MPPERDRTSGRGGWEPKHYLQLIALGTSSLCMVGIVGVIVIGIASGTLPVGILGDYKTGTGLIGVLAVFYFVIRKALG